MAAEGGTRASEGAEARATEGADPLWTNSLCAHIVVVGQEAGCRGFRHGLHPSRPFDIPTTPGGDLRPSGRLWIRGDRVTFTHVGVAVIGARAASPEGLTAAYEIAFDLARAGVVVISGLARGIDSSAHRGALDGGGRTIAVLGTGIDVVYPSENAELSRNITASGLLSRSFLQIPLPRTGTFRGATASSAAFRKQSSLSKPERRVGR